jgi:hypothetical protein
MGKCRPDGGPNRMTIDFCGIPFHLVDNVDLVVATKKHLFIIDDQRREIEEAQYGSVIIPSRR